MSIELNPDLGQQNSVDAKLQQLGIQLSSDIPYRLETMFPRLEGWGAKGEIKKKAKVIRNVEPVLAELLRPGEEVLYIAKGVQYSFFEQYFMGIWALTINQTVFVLTNVRLLMFRTDSSGRPKRTSWMIYYSQIEVLKANWMGVLNLKLRDKRKLQFSGFSKSDRQTMPRIFEPWRSTGRAASIQTSRSPSKPSAATAMPACPGSTSAAQAAEASSGSPAPWPSAVWSFPRGETSC
jgi:hypothetical protein